MPSGEPTPALVLDRGSAAIFLHSAVVSAAGAILVGESVFNAIYSNCHEHEHCSQHAHEYATRLAMLDKLEATDTF